MAQPVHDIDIEAADPIELLEGLARDGFDDEQLYRAALVDFSVDRDDELPVGVQLTWKIRAMIAGRILRPGDRLPSVRELAEISELNVNTARAAYGKLIDRGLIESRHGEGTFVSEAASSSPGLDEIAAEAMSWARANGIEPRELAMAIYSASGAAAQTAASPTELPSVDTDASEAQVRRALRGQIARLESELGHYAWEGEFEAGPSYLHPPAGRIRTASELEGIRDELISRLTAARADAERRGLAEQQARGQVERMIREPDSHRWDMITSELTGDPDCRNWRVVPRFGPVGAIMGWWRVKVSSGCPLSGAA